MAQRVLGAVSESGRNALQFKLLPVRRNNARKNARGSEFMAVNWLQARPIHDGS
jgi:hypothetical protein